MLDMIFMSAGQWKMKRMSWEGEERYFRFCAMVESSKCPLTAEQEKTE